MHQMKHLEPAIHKENARFTLIVECGTDRAIAHVFLRGNRHAFRGLLIALVRQLRQQTQKELAQQLCVSERAISRLETGAPISRIGLADIEEALGQEKGSLRI